MTFDASLVEEYWHLLCHRSEVSTSGSYIRFETVIGEITVFNDGSNVVAFDNLCPHRGARIYTEDCGRRPATCGYHGWTFRSGRMFVAASERFARCPPEDLLPRLYQVDWFADFLFVAIRPRTPLAEQIAGLEGRLRSISANIAKRRDLSHYMYECYWPIAVENALEPYHIDKIHPATLGLLRLEDGENQYLGKNSVWTAAIGDMNTNKRLKSLGKLFNVPKAFPGYEFVFLFPFTMISSTYGYSYSVQNFFPGKNGATGFYSRLFSSRAVNDKAEIMLESFFDSSASVNRKVFAEDHDVCKLVPAQSWTMDPLKFAADSEGKIQHFRLTCREHAKTL